MAWLAVDKDGTEYIYPEHPEKDYPSKNCWNCVEYCTTYYVDLAIPLSKGTIFKLIGKELTWDDEPVEI